MASLSLQVVLISSGILSLALLWKVSVPLVVDFSVYHAPVLWSSLASWLRPPYLYVILNCIIIIIAASSRFHHSHAGHKDQQEHVSAPKITVREADFHYDMKISAADQVLSDYGGVESTASEVVYELKEATAAVFDEDKSTAMVNTPNGPVKAEVKGDEDDFVISKSTWMPTKRTDSSENLPELLLLPAEKPLVSARFGNRKPVKDSSDGGRALRVAKLKRHETLENTWKMITEGRAMPLTRHLKKSDTFDNRGRQVNMSEVDPSLPKKSATFQDRTNHQLPSVNNNSSPPSGKLRKEPSLSQDELNRRVESFIKKFNEEMRLQRQESLNQYKEMISRGSH